jgi:S-adenosylmethionine hydrolase
MPVVTLTTEWKPDDVYNGIIKGKLSSMSPGTVIIDNASSIPAFNISIASFIIRNTFHNYPNGSVHIICVHSEPDEVIIIEHGETSDELEIFAKAAADILSGIKLSDLGRSVKTINEKVPFRATIEKDVITGSIIFIDSYGNAITNITREIFYRVFEDRNFSIHIQRKSNCTDHISLKYSDVPVNEILARFNQFDLLELSINGKDMSELFDLEIGSALRVDNTHRTIPSDKLL